MHMKKTINNSSGRIETFSVKIPSLREKTRKIRVFLPASYDFSPEKTYPVLYMHDGQNLFYNRDTKFKNGAWRVHLTLDRLVKEQGLRELIVVGLPSAEFDRADELSFLPRKRQFNGTKTINTLGAKYMEFFTHGLIDIIGAKYRIDPEIRYVGGSSMGGIASLLLALTPPYLYQGALCFTPAGMIHYQNEVKHYFNTAIHELKALNRPLPKLYFMVGGIGLETIIKPFCDFAVPYLVKHGYEYGKNITYLYKPRAVHNENAWARVLPHALTWLLASN